MKLRLEPKKTRNLQKRTKRYLSKFQEIWKEEFGFCKKFGIHQAFGNICTSTLVLDLRGYKGCDKSHWRFNVLEYLLLKKPKSN